MTGSIRLILLGFLWSWLVAGSTQAVSFTPFGAAGEGGSTNGQTISVGAGGRVFELDALAGIAGQDLNGGFAGTTAQLSLDPLPTGLGFDFQATLSGDASDLTLRYELRNDSGAGIAGLSFFSFLDAEIDEPVNGFFNEFAQTSGTLAAGQSFEVDEPGFSFGDLFDNLRAGALDGTNALPPGTPDDVAMALGFEIGLLDIGEIARFEVMISEDGDRLGSFAIAHSDSGAGSDGVITFSGRSAILRPPDPSDPAIPEPSAALLFAIGALVAASCTRGGARR